MIRLIANILGSAPLEDAATRDMFLEVMRFCHGEHGRLFPKVQTRPDQFIRLAFRDSGLAKAPISIMCEYNVPGMLFRYCAELKSLDKEGYLKLKYQREGVHVNYRKMIAIYIRTNMRME